MMETKYSILLPFVLATSIVASAAGQDVLFVINEPADSPGNQSGLIGWSKSLGLR